MKFVKIFIDKMKNINLTKQEILNRIGYFRNKKKISAYKLGRDLGHSKTYFYRIESGEIQLTLETFLDVLEILGVSTFEFFYPNLEDFQTDLTCLKTISNLTDEEKQSLLTILKVKK